MPGWSEHQGVLGPDRGAGHAQPHPRTLQSVSESPRTPGPALGQLQVQPQVQLQVQLQVQRGRAGQRPSPRAVNSGTGLTLALRGTESTPRRGAQDSHGPALHLLGLLGLGASLGQVGVTRRDWNKVPLLPDSSSPSCPSGLGSGGGRDLWPPGKRATSQATTWPV